MKIPVPSGALGQRITSSRTATSFGGLPLVRQVPLTVKSFSSGPSLMLADFTALGGSKKNLKPWKPKAPISVSETADPAWRFGDGGSGEGLDRKHVEIDPFKEGRSWFKNYTLLVSGIVPRPIGFVSTIGKDGSENLAPFSYFQCVDHDPPVFVFGFTGRKLRPKDTLRNLEATGECVINVVSEHMIDAVNASSIDVPYEESEWKLTGLHQAPSTTVKPARVKESIFSIEGKLVDIIDFKTSRSPAGEHGRMAVVEGTRFWVREDALNEEQSHIDLDVLRPIGQLGGVSYARITDTFELTRSNWKRAQEEDPGRLEEVFSNRTK